MKSALTFAATLLCAAPLFAQQPPAAPAGPPPAHAAKAHTHSPLAREARNDRSVERTDEMEDFDALGLPMGDFWQNPMLVANLGLTPDQVKRLADISLQSRLQLIQLDATLQTEQLKFEPLTAGPNIDPQAALAQADRIADARAAIEKADARMAFGLRAVLTPDQLAKLHGPRMDDPMRPGTKPAPVVRK